MQVKGIKIEAKDQVITLTEQAKAQDVIVYTTQGQICEVTALEEIPRYHKAAVADIKKGERVFKYGEEIGEAVEDIRKGQWVHTHNLKSTCLAK